MGSLTHINKVLHDHRLQNISVNLPFVSVVVTNYNYEQFLVLCLKSIQLQTYKHFECIIVDDCSIDNSLRITLDFIREESLENKFRIVRHETNLGQLAGFRTGLMHATGEFVVYVDADDMLLADFIEKHIQAHLSFIPVAFTSSNQYQVNERGNLIGGTHPDLRAHNEVVRVITMNLYSPPWVWATTSSIMFRKSILEIIMPTDTSGYLHCADNYLCHFANIIGGSMLLPENLGCYRRHGKNCFSNNSLVGLRTPTGDMRNHPSHNTLVAKIKNQILYHFNDFIKLQSEQGLLKTLSKILTPTEVYAYYQSINKQKCNTQGRVILRKSFLFKLLLFTFAKYTKFQLSRSTGLMIAPSLIMEKADTLHEG